MNLLRDINFKRKNKATPFYIIKNKFESKRIKRPMKMPLVSICIPVYNGSLFLKEALESILNQTYTNIEVIISDDNSSDNSLQIINDFKKRTEIPFHIYNHKPSGIGANWNNCVRHANGDYIKFLFQDDTISSSCVAKMIDLALSDSKVGLVYCKRKILYDIDNIDHQNWIRHSGILHQSWFGIKVVEGLLDGKKCLSDLNLVNNPLNKIGEPTAVLIKKSCFNKVGYFDENLKQALDINFWFRLMKHYKIGFIDEELISFRLHKDQATFLNHLNKINETDLVNKEFYKSYFWFLHPKNQWKLFKSQSRIGYFVRSMKRTFTFSNR